jgi:hypothetical protein
MSPRRVALDFRWQLAQAVSGEDVLLIEPSPQNPWAQGTVVDVDYDADAKRVRIQKWHMGGPPMGRVVLALDAVAIPLDRLSSQHQVEYWTGERWETLGTVDELRRQQKSATAE